MRHEHHHHIHFPGQAETQELLKAVLGELKDVKKELHKMSAATDRLKASVANLTTVEQSAVTLLGQLAQQIRDNAEDPAALNALADEIDADAQGLSAAVTANTPAAPGGDTGGETA